MIFPMLEAHHCLLWHNPSQTVCKPGSALFGIMPPLATDSTPGLNIRDFVISRP
jgi:hypothetical protein